MTPRLNKIKKWYLQKALDKKLGRGEDYYEALRNAKAAKLAERFQPNLVFIRDEVELPPLARTPGGIEGADAFEQPSTGPVFSEGSTKNKTRRRA